MQDVQQQLVSAVQQELQHRDNHLVSQQQQQQQQQQQVQHLMQQLSDVISRIKGLSSTTAVDVRSQSNGQSNRQSNGQSNQQSNAQSTGHKRTAAARGVPSTRQSHSRLKLLKPPCTLAETIGINKTALQTLSEDAHRTLDYVQQLVFAHMKADKIILAGPPWVREALPWHQSHTAAGSAVLPLFSSGKGVQALLLSKGLCRHYNWKLLDWRPKACQGCHCRPVNTGQHVDLFPKLHAALENP
jgi:undecaprenyl pyrophosphate synthase